MIEGGRLRLGSIALAGIVAACASTPQSPPDLPIPAHAVVGVQETQLNPDFWIRRDPAGDHVVLDARAIAAQNARLRELDPSVHDIEKLPATLDTARVRGWIERL